MSTTNTRNGSMIRRRSVTTNKIGISHLHRPKHSIHYTSQEKTNGSTVKHYRYYVGNGNNSNLIRKVLSTRKNWIQITDPHYMFINFKWQQSNKGFNYDSCVDNKIFRHTLNHLEFHQELSNKEMLLKNMSDFCEANKINVFDYLPVTFVLNTASPDFDEAQSRLIKFYEDNLPETMKHKEKKQWLNVPRRRITTNSYSKKNSYHYSKPELKRTFTSISSSYLWILKPTFYNRGRGIHLFNTIGSLEQLMRSYLEDTSVNLNSRIKTMSRSAIVPQMNSTELCLENKKTLRKFRVREIVSHNTNKVITNSFIIQKYLQCPFLIDSRKFDIRVWVLFNHDSKVYFYRQGYVRTSSSPYTAKEDNLEDLSIHLTNNSIQKGLTDYGKFEEGNQLSFKFLQNYVAKYGGNFDKIMESMKKIVKMSALSVKRKINKNCRNFCFEVFGYDFMIDSDFKVWLIEVNTNPCLQQSSLILENLLPRMIDDAFKLSIDQIFQESSQGNKTNYVLLNHHNDDNLWDFVVDLKKLNFGV